MQDIAYKHYHSITIEHECHLFVPINPKIQKGKGKTEKESRDQIDLERLLRLHNVHEIGGQSMPIETIFSIIILYYHHPNIIDNLRV